MSDHMSSRVPAGPARHEQGVRVPQLVMSLLVIALFGLLAVWWQAQSNARTPALALAADVEAGVPLTSADLTEVHLSSDVPMQRTPPEFRDVFVGVAPVADMKAGTIITESMFRRSAPLGPNEALVGLRLAGDEAPSSLVVGDRVQVLRDANGEVEVLAADARVDFVTPSNGDGGLAVRLRLGVAEAQVVQLASGRVVVIEVDATGPASWELSADAGGESDS